jgi:hypothetical protein
MTRIGEGRDLGRLEGCRLLGLALRVAAPLCCTDVRDSAARFRDRLFRGNQESAGGRRAVWRRVSDKLTW